MARLAFNAGTTVAGAVTAVVAASTGAEISAILGIRASICCVASGVRILTTDELEH